MYVEAYSELFSRKATKEALAKARQGSAAVCPICQDMYSKKNRIVQCQFCAKNCCSQCCYKSRLDPQAKNAENADKCLICEDCQSKYRNVILNQGFRRKYVGLNKLMEELKTDINRIDNNCKQQQQRIEQPKPKEDPQALNRTMKVAKLRKQLQTTQKDIEKIIKDTLIQKEKIIKLEAQRIQKEAQAEEAKKRKEELRIQQEKRIAEERILQQKRLEDAKKQAEAKLIEEERLKKQQQHIRLKEQQEKQAHLLISKANAQRSQEFDVINQEKEDKKIVHSVIATQQNLQSDQEKISKSKEQNQISDNNQTSKQLDAALNIKQTVVSTVKQPQQDTPTHIKTQQQSSQKQPHKIHFVLPTEKIEETSQKPTNSNTEGENDKIKEIIHEEEKKPTSEQKKSDAHEHPIVEDNKTISSEKPKNTKSERSPIQKAHTPRNKLEEKEQDNVSRTYSECTPGSKLNVVKQNMVKPGSGIYELGKEDKEGEQDHMSKSVIIEPEKENETTKRRQSRNMTEKEILALRIPPIKNHKLYNESHEKARLNLNSSVKQSSSVGLIQSTPTVHKKLNQPDRQLSKEQILRKSRNEDMDQTQTPGVDEKSKCNCSIF